MSIENLFIRFSGLRRSLSQDAELARIFREGNRDPSMLRTDELSRYYSVMDGFFALCPGDEHWWPEGTQTIFPDRFRFETEQLRSGEP